MKHITTPLTKLAFASVLSTSGIISLHSIDSGLTDKQYAPAIPEGATGQQLADAQARRDEALNTASNKVLAGSLGALGTLAVGGIAALRRREEKQEAEFMAQYGSSSQVSPAVEKQRDTIVTARGQTALAWGAPTETVALHTPAPSQHPDFSAPEFKPDWAAKIATAHIASEQAAPPPKPAAPHTGHPQQYQRSLLFGQDTVLGPELGESDAAWRKRQDAIRRRQQRQQQQQ